MSSMRNWARHRVCRRLDANGYETAEMSSSLYHFAQKRFKE